MELWVTVAPSNSKKWNYKWQWHRLTVINGVKFDEKVFGPIVNLPTHTQSWEIYEQSYLRSCSLAEKVGLRVPSLRSPRYYKMFVIFTWCAHNAAHFSCNSISGLTPFTYFWFIVSTEVKVGLLRLLNTLWLQLRDTQYAVMFPDRQI